MKMSVLILVVCLLASIPGKADAVDCRVKVVFSGKGAGQVTFDGAVHSGRGIACAQCHEHRGLSLPLFEKQKGSTMISMRKMAMGRACGYCHDVVDETKCSKCHKKE